MLLSHRRNAVSYKICVAGIGDKSVSFWHTFGKCKSTKKDPKIQCEKKLVWGDYFLEFLAIWRHFGEGSGDPKCMQNINLLLVFEILVPFGLLWVTSGSFWGLRGPFWAAEQSIEFY